MKLAVVGAGGLVGRHVVAAAARAHHDVIEITRQLPGGERVDFDVGLDRVASVCNRSDVIVWAAALPSVEGCQLDPVRTRAFNVDVVSRLGPLLRRDVAFIGFSSEYVFDGQRGDNKYRERDDRNPINEYGEQKLDLEDTILSMPSSAVLRTSGVFGNEPKRKNFVCQLIDASKQQRKVVVANDQWITPTPADALGRVVVDVASALVAGRFTGVLHAAGPQVLRRDAFAQLVAHAFGLDDVIVARPTSEMGLAAPRPLRVGLDTTLLQQLTESIPPPAEALLLLRDQQ